MLWRLQKDGTGLIEPTGRTRLKPGVHLSFWLRFHFVLLTSADRFSNMFSAGFDRFKDKCSRERAGQVTPGFVAEPYDWAS